MKNQAQYAIRPIGSKGYAVYLATTVVFSDGSVVERLLRRMGNLSLPTIADAEAHVAYLRRHAWINRRIRRRIRTVRTSEPGYFMACRPDWSVIDFTCGDGANTLVILVPAGADLDGTEPASDHQMGYRDVDVVMDRLIAVYGTAYDRRLTAAGAR